MTSFVLIGNVIYILPDLFDVFDAHLLFIEFAMWSGDGRFVDFFAWVKSYSFLLISIIIFTLLKMSHKNQTLINLNNRFFGIILYLINQNLHNH